MTGSPPPAERRGAEVHMTAAPDAGAAVAAVVAAAGQGLGLARDPAARLAEVAGAVVTAVLEAGFDDPAAASVDVSVVASGHRVIVRVDDEGLPFGYQDEDALDGAVLTAALADGWVDEVHHRWRGRDGNRTELVRHLDPGADLRAGSTPPSAVAVASEAPHVTARRATPADADAICRLTWRTYGPTYQHDEYYQPERLARMLADGTQVSFVVELDSGEVVGHTALLVEEPGGVVVEAGRAMVDPRVRGHHLLSVAHSLEGAWFAEHGVLGIVGAAVTAHTRSQRDTPVASVLLGFLPPIEFEGIEGTGTALREAVVGGFVAMAAIPPQPVHLPARDAEMVARIHRWFALDRPTAEGSGDPGVGRSAIEQRVRGDLGHTVLVVEHIGSDLADEVARRRAAAADGGVAVTYVDLRLDDPATSWAADALADSGFVFAGVLPLERGGIDLVRYQHLGGAPVDPSAIHLRHESARELLAYVLDQLGERS